MKLIFEVSPTKCPLHVPRDATKTGESYSVKATSQKPDPLWLMIHKVIITKTIKYKIFAQQPDKKL